MVIIFLAIICHALASILLKKGALMIDHFSLKEIITNIYYLGSLFFLFLQAILWQLTLKKYPLSEVYIYMSLYYPAVLISSYFIFNESISLCNICGTVIIVTGLSLEKITNKKKYV